MKGFSQILVLVGVMLIIGVGVGGYYLGQRNFTPTQIFPAPTGVACTLEAKLCPDGTSVGRSGPNCEFTACPVSDSQIKDMRDGKIYQNYKYGFEIQIPEDSIVQDQDIDESSPYKYIRIQNYTDQQVIANGGSIIAGQFYLEIFVYNRDLGQKPDKVCPEGILDPKEVDLGTGVLGYTGKQDPEGIEGDSSRFVYVTCGSKSNIDFYIHASENKEVVARKILDSFKFL